MVYTWKAGAHIKADAQVAGEMCAQLEAQGNLTARALLDANRPEDAPLHDEFEWRDGVAAEKYRESQARCIIRSLVVISASPVPTRGFYHIDVKESNYHSVQTIMNQEETADKLYRMALGALQSARRAYSAVAELVDVYVAIDKAQADYDAAHLEAAEVTR